MAKLLEMVRSNLPHIRQRSGSYKVLDNENMDPFTRGISFNAQFVASVQVPTAQQDCPEVQDKVKAACDMATEKSLRNVELLVKSNNIRVFDFSNKVYHDYPITVIAYGGWHLEKEDIFFFIHKTKVEKELWAEVFRLESAAKAKTVTAAVAIVFNTAYKEWLTRKRSMEREKKQANWHSELISCKSIHRRN